MEVEKIGEIFSDDIIGESPDMNQKIVGIKNIILISDAAYPYGSLADEV